MGVGSVIAWLARTAAREVGTPRSTKAFGPVSGGTCGARVGRSARSRRSLRGPRSNRSLRFGRPGRDERSARSGRSWRSGRSARRGQDGRCGQGGRCSRAGRRDHASRCAERCGRRGARDPCGPDAGRGRPAEHGPDAGRGRLAGRGPRGRATPGEPARTRPDGSTMGGRPTASWRPSRSQPASRPSRCSSTWHPSRSRPSLRPSRGRWMWCAVRIGARGIAGRAQPRCSFVSGRVVFNASEMAATGPGEETLLNEDGRMPSVHGLYPHNGSPNPYPGPITGSPPTRSQAAMQDLLRGEGAP